MLNELGIDLPTGLLLALALLLALSFEFVNGFHDTANAVATVIYTNSLKPTQAVVWSGTWNLIGVLTSSGAVAFGIVALLPVELVMNVGSGPGFAMVFALLVSAIIWNLGTWYLGLPASSSHTLIGSIVGVGLMNSVMSPGSAFGDGVNWAKVADTVKALVLSPLIGFLAAGALLLLARALLRRPELYAAPDGKRPPPWWVRVMLVLTCTGVSFAHGSNDGQKGMGLIVLILAGIVPAAYALKLDTPPATVQHIAQQAQSMSHALDAARPPGAALPDTGTAQHRLTTYLRTGQFDADGLGALAALNSRIAARLGAVPELGRIDGGERKSLRLDLYLVAETLTRLGKAKALPGGIDPKPAAEYAKALKGLTSFIPVWVKVAVALALGVGTMIGWKRIVVTVGEKIGKAHLSYAQGASAELVAFGTIEAADVLGLPVSTTHILSSGIAGTMVANGAGLQKSTVRNILLAWVLTLPVCVALGAALFGAGLFFVLRIAGVP
ncbi:MAG: inorganic phosphate transporter [Proteobacteria bacterium]|nr:inorganic phosphate transporter [Pseudomonadota bacterium]